MYKKKISILAILSIFTILICTAVTFASVLFRSFVESEGTITTGSVDKIVNIDDANESPVQISSLTQNISFNKAGDSTTLTVQVNNNIASVVQYKYEFAFDSNTFTLQTESFASCILVYFNGEFIDTLGNICANANNRVEKGYIDFSGYINKASNSASSITDTIKFELHSSSDMSIFDNDASMSFKLRVYAQTADYEHNMFVSNESELVKAFNDLNYGILPLDEKIILFGNINLTKNFTLNYPVIIDLNGYKLDVNSNLVFAGEDSSVIKSSKAVTSNSLSSNGTITINNSDGILNIEDFYSTNGTNIGYLYSNISTATSYDSELLDSLVETRVNNKLRYGLASEASINLLGGLAFYNLTVTTSSNLTYTKPNLIADSESYNEQESVTIGTNKYGVKIISSTNDAILTSILQNELLHLVNLSEEDENNNLIRTNAADLFFPTSIKSKNVTIEWVSSDESLISNTGIISSNISGDATLTIYAHININDQIYTRSFRIKTMSQNHETIFQYFVAQLSPIEIDEVYSGSNKDTAYYFLPIVDSNYDPVNNSNYSGFDYRSSYSTPENKNPGYVWEGFNNVGFEYITYTPISTYNFVSLDQEAMINTKTGVAVYLNQATFQTFAQVQVSAKFNGDEEVYSSPVNLIIKLGYNTELNELVFNKVSEDLNDVNVLQNILNTRMATTNGGMKNEKGDFYLDGSYQTYKISYSIPTSSQYAINKIEGYAVNDDGTLGNLVAYIEYGETFTSEQIASIGRYKICLNIEGFDTSDSNFGVTTILSMPGVQTTASRILYFKCPGVIKNDDTGFANMSVFNSVKYQVFKELRDDIALEQGNDDVENLNYTNSNDTISFVVSGTTVTNYTGAYILRHDANLCTKLVFSLAEANTEVNATTDNHKVYGLARIIDWAVGPDSSTTFGTYFEGILDSTFISSHSSIIGNGLTYVNGDEETIIKDYYLTYIKNNTTNWNNIWNNVSYTFGDKYTILNSASFLEKAQAYYNAGTGTYGSKNSDGTYSKFQAVYNWANNTLDTSGGDNGRVGEPPNYGLIGSAEWNIDLSATTYSSAYVFSKWNGVSNWASSKYAVNGDNYLEDNTEYFASNELEILIVALLNSRTTSSSGANNAVREFVFNLIQEHFKKPTYFTTTGIHDLIAQAYSDLGKTVSYDGFTSDITSFTVMGESFSTPHVTMMDWSTIGFDYFPNLKTLYIKGDTTGKLKAFHTTEALSTFFNRVTSNNSNLEYFAVEYSSDSLIDFSIKTIGNLKKLKKISLYHNQGITNIGALLKLDLENLTYVDVADINLKNEYSEFVLQAINLKATTTPEIFYTPDGTNLHSNYYDSLSNDAEGLIYLEEFYELLAENSNMTQSVYTNTGSQAIQWKIEEGNGITLVTNSYTNNQMSDLAYSLSPILIKYYLVTTAFRYGGYNFLANHLYWIYNDGNGNIVFETVKDENDNDIVVTVGTAPSSLTESEVDAYISDNNIQGQTGLTDTTVSYGTPTGTNNNWNTSISTSTNTLIIYDKDDNVLATLNNVYRIGYNNNTVTRTVSTTTYNYNFPLYSIEITKYYATLSNGYYSIYKTNYSVVKTDGGLYTSSTLNQTETFRNIVYSNYRTGIINYRYTYTSLFSSYPNAFSIKFGNDSYNLSTYKNFNYKITNGTTTTGSGTINSTLNVERNYSNLYYTAIPLNQTMYQTIETALDRKYIFANSTTNWYDQGTQKTITLAYGGHTISLNNKSSGGGFTYSSTLTESGAEAQSYKAALAMRDILNEANSHLNDSMFGLYYHNYYAFPGTVAVSFKIGDFKANFKAYGVYYLEIGSDGKFYWAQDSRTNAQTYEILTGDYTAVTNVVATLNSTYDGKIYYYTGTANGGMTQGTNVFYQVCYSKESGNYQLKRFGVLGSSYVLCDGNGDFNNSWAVSTYGTPSSNATAFKVLCNQMRYLDSNFFVNSSTSTNFTYGVGGVRQAVFTAMITVNGVKYERKFVINVYA